MRKHVFKIFLIGVSFLLGIGIFWRCEYVKYQEYINAYPLTGTIATWSRVGNLNKQHFVLLNPNDADDYVEFDFDFDIAVKAVGAESMGAVFFDGNGIYALVFVSPESGAMKLFYISPAGIDSIAGNPVCKERTFSGFIQSNDALFLKLDQNLYEIDDCTKSVRLVKDFGKNEMWVYPYKNGIVYQSGDDVRFYSESEDTILAHVPNGMGFDGWYEVGKSILVRTLPHSESYVMDLETGTLRLFSKFSFSNCGHSQNNILLMPLPIGGGGATPLDVEYTWSYLLGNEIFLAFYVSMYNIDTGRIKHFYNIDIFDNFSLLDIPYDRERFENLKEGILKSISGGVVEDRDKGDVNNRMGIDRNTEAVAGSKG